MTIATCCSSCLRVQEFDDSEIGDAWLSVQVMDGDADDPLMELEFCSPACLAVYFADPENMGTIVFPAPCDCASNGKDHIVGCASQSRKG